MTDEQRYELTTRPRGHLRCCECKGDFPPTMFYKDSTRTRGYGSRCRSCEAKRDKRRAKHRLEGRRYIILQAKSHPCMDCGHCYPPGVMALDHRPGTEKLFELSRWSRMGFVDILEELAKCDAVCSNCHRLRTIARIEARGEEAPVSVEIADD